MNQAPVQVCFKDKCKASIRTEAFVGMHLSFTGWWQPSHPTEGMKIAVAFEVISNGCSLLVKKCRRTRINKTKPKLSFLDVLLSPVHACSRVNSHVAQK